MKVALKAVAFCLAGLFTSAAGSAQDKFPLRPGEWTSTTPDPTGNGGSPMTALFCMNDETWTKALKGNPTCTMQQLNITSMGASYSLSCASESFQMKGTFKIAFDGKTHMVSTGTVETTVNGKTSPMAAKTDFRWKGPTCDPAVDLNLRTHSRVPQ